MDELKRLIVKAEKTFEEHFEKKTWFERALFFSWSCSIRDCQFCYMSTQKPQGTKEAVRSKESVYAEAILCKALGWKIGFLSGGVNAYRHEDILETLKAINIIVKEKIWLNIGVIPEEQLKEYKPYIKGVVGSIETVNKELHDKICPSKPMEPYTKMFECSSRLGLKNAMTIILGVGETKEDFEELKRFIKKNKIEKIHLYALNPVKDTMFEGKKSPDEEYHAWYIAKTRTEFPRIDIQMGIWKDKVKRIPILLKAGANSISKFPITRLFGKKVAEEIERQAKLGGREFVGTLSKIPKADWECEIRKIPIDKNRRAIVRKKLFQYLEKMSS